MYVIKVEYVPKVLAVTPTSVTIVFAIKAQAIS